MKRVKDSEAVINGTRTEMRKFLYSLITAILAFAIVGMATFAWFALPDEAFGGFNVTTLSANLQFGSTMRVTRSLGTRVNHTVYRRNDGSGLFYQYDDEADEFVYEEGDPIPFFISGLLPGETLDIEIDVAKIDIDDLSYLIGFKNMFGRQFEVNGNTYDILGMYKTRMISADGAARTNDEVWLFDFGTVGDGFTPTRHSDVIVYNGSWSDDDADGDGIITVCFRISVDLAQYTALRTVHYFDSDDIFESEMSIGTLYVSRV